MEPNISFGWPPDPSGVFAIIWPDDTSARLDLNKRSGSCCSPSGGRRDVDPRYVEALGAVVASGDENAVRAWLEANPNPSRPPQGVEEAEEKPQDAAPEPERRSVATKLFDLGYKDLVSVIPPDADLSSKSRIDPDSRGKVPGRYGPSGWHGFAWDKPADRALAEEIDQTGANIGLRAERFPGLDIDSEDAKLTKAVLRTAKEILGPAPTRLSREPRRLLMYRTEQPFPKRAVVIQYKGQSHTVELLADGQQYLISGRHPSGARYRWESFEANPDNLTQVNEAMVEQFFETLKERLEAKGLEVELTRHGQKRTGPAEAVPDEIPHGARNTTLASIAGTFRRRNIPQDAAFEALKGINLDRCSPPMDDDEVERIVESIYRYDAPPLEIVRAAWDVFDAVPEAGKDGESAIKVYTPGELFDRPKPERRWRVQDLIPPTGSCALVAKPKVGKSTLARALAVAVAQGTDWLDKACEQGSVIYVKFPNEGRWEEAAEEFARLGLERGDPLYFVDVEKYQDRKTMFRFLQELHRKTDPALIIIDTLQHLIQVDDLNDYATVHRALQPISHFSNSSLVLFLHHEKKGKSSMADAGLGSIAFFGAMEVNFRLRRDQSDSKARYLEAQGRGVEMEPRNVEIDPDSHEPYLGGTPREQRLEAIEAEMLAALDSGEILHRTLTRGQDRDGPQHKAIERLEARGLVERLGKGVKGDPYRWRLIDVADVFRAVDEGGLVAPEAAARPAAKQTPYFEESGNSPPDDEATDLSDEAGEEGSDA